MALTYTPGLDLLYIRCEEANLEKLVTALVGKSADRRLVFDPDRFVRPELIGGLQVMAETVMRLLDNPAAAVSKAALRELEQAIAIQFLQGTSHNFSRFLASDGVVHVPHQARRAAEFIDANWSEAITIERLVEVTGISSRMLFKAFLKTYGMSPMVFVKRKRLEEARRALESGEPTMSVTRAAIECGFLNQGHFARDYRLYFGEVPSRTLQRHSS
jgi:transcriptional regulator GlxA family with amidase domain